VAKGFEALKQDNGLWEDEHSEHAVQQQAQTLHILAEDKPPVRFTNNPEKDAAKDNRA